MKKLASILISISLLIPAQASAETTTSTPKPSASKAKVDKKPIVKKEKKEKKKVFKKKKKLPAKKAIKWPPPGFEKKAGLYAKTATPKELLIAGTENKYIQKKLIKYCDEVACLGIFVGSETGCDWWEVSSNVLGIDPADPTKRIIYGSLTTLVAGSKARTIKTILLVSDEPIADGLGISAYTANCRTGTTTQKIPSNTYTKSPNRI
jgi:hypothetical protein